MVATLPRDHLCRLLLTQQATSIQMLQTPISLTWPRRPLLLQLSWSRTLSSTQVSQSPHRTSSRSSRSMSFHHTKHTNYFCSRSSSRKHYYSHPQQPQLSKCPIRATQLMLSRNERRSLHSGMTWSGASRKSNARIQILCTDWGLVLHEEPHQTSPCTDETTRLKYGLFIFRWFQRNIIYD